MQRSNAATDVKLVAFFLPQFHPIPENDRWWGKGFTEWTNVVKARPLFEGHYQPHLPADLGFYDLRLRAARHDQIRMAKAHGIDAFCYHYYWFSGHRLLHEPLDDMLADPVSDMPFCLCWANENWTRRWDGSDHKVLIEQRHLPDDDAGFIDSVLPFLRDPRYLKIDGAPILIVYQPQSLPDSARTVRIWRERCRAAGIARLHLCAAMTQWNGEFERYGFDSGVEFPPHNLDSLSLKPPVAFTAPFLGRMWNYEDAAACFLERDYGPGRPVYRTVFPSWDNTARRGRRATIMLNSTPANYEHWLAEAIRLTRDAFPEQERLVFINAWNEWAEGCHLEPDQAHGLAYLEATLRAKEGRSDRRGFNRRTTPIDDSPDRPSLVRDLARVVAAHGSKWLHAGERSLARAVHDRLGHRRRLKLLLRWLYGAIRG
jgi:lipopolysaccharide biosynthesis protein